MAASVVACGGSHQVGRVLHERREVVDLEPVGLALLLGRGVGALRLGELALVRRVEDGLVDEDRAVLLAPQPAQLEVLELRAAHLLQAVALGQANSLRHQ